MIQSTRTVDPAPDGPGTAELLEALSHEASREILRCCVREPCAVQEICQETGIPTATAYRHINDLRESGVLVRTRSAISETGNRYDLYRTPFESLQLCLDGSGVELVLDGDNVEP